MQIVDIRFAILYDFKVPLTIYVGGKKLKLYDTFRAECSQTWIFGSSLLLSSRMNHLMQPIHVFLVIKIERNFICNKYIAPISFLIFDTKFKPILLVLFIVSINNLRYFPFIPLFNKEPRNSTSMHLYFIVVL